MNLFKRIKEKTFNFSIEETVRTGEAYNYKVKAETRDEAVAKLVEYFFGEKDFNADIEAKHVNLDYPFQKTFSFHGMPEWLAKRASGYTKSGNVNYHEQLEQYAKEHNITLKK